MNIREQTTKITTSEHMFYLTIKNTAGVITIFIGGKRKGCVNATLNTEDSLLVQRGFHSLESATLPILKWFPDCSIDEPLPKGQGTIHMIKTLLSEIKRRYPYIRTIVLTDNSHIECSNGRSISLLSLSISKYTQTWYEKYFGAILKHPDEQAKYKRGCSILIDSTLKPPFDIFTSIIELYTTPSIILKLKPYYETTTSYKDFLTKLFNEEGRNTHCILIVDWIDKFLEYIFEINLQSLSWIISNDSIEDIPIVAEEIVTKNPYSQHAGTRKNKSRKLTKSYIDYSDSIYTS